MPLDPTLVFRGLGGVVPDYNRSAADQVSLATAGQTLKDRQLRYQADQIALKQQQDAEAQRQIIDKSYSDALADAMSPKPTLTPAAVAAQGGSPATPLVTKPDGTPTLAQPETPTPTPGPTTTVNPTAVQPGVEALPGPGGITAEGNPIQQISPEAPPQDRPTVGEMMGPVTSNDPATAETPPAEPTAPPLPAASPQSTPATMPQDGGNPHPIELVNRVVQDLAKAGHGQRAMQVWQAAHLEQAKLNEQVAKGQIEQTNAQKARYGQAANDLMYFIKDTPDAMKESAWGGWLAQERRSGNITPEEQQQFAAYPGTAMLPELHSRLIGQTQALDHALKQRQADEASARLQETQAKTEGERRKNFQSSLEDTAGQLQEATSQEQYSAVRDAIKDPSLKARFPVKFDADTPAKVARIGMTQEQKLKERESQKNPTEWSIYLKAANGDPVKALALREKYKLDLAKASKSDTNVGGALTPDALQMFADAMRAGKPLPPLGRNSTGTIAAISNLAAKQGNDEGKPVDLATSAANYKADSDSLKKATASLDSLSAFENSAIKNLKLFTDAAAKIPDTGVPWLNTPVRLLDQKLVGSKDMAVVNAARQIGLREIARITNDPKMSGQLTDSARHEVMGFSPENATLPQILAVAKIVQQDVKNVHEGLATQKAAIQSRIGKGSGQKQESPSLPSTLSASDVGKTYLNKEGKTIKVTAVNPKDGTQFRFDEVK